MFYCFAGSDLVSSCVHTISVYQAWLASQVFHDLLSLLPSSPCFQILPASPCSCRFAARLWGRALLVRLLWFSRASLVAPQPCWGSCAVLPARLPTARAGPGAPCRWADSWRKEDLPAPWPSSRFACTGSRHWNSLLLFSSVGRWRLFTDMSRDFLCY